MPVYAKKCYEVGFCEGKENGCNQTYCDDFQTRYPEMRKLANELSGEEVTKISFTRAEDGFLWVSDSQTNELREED